MAARFQALFSACYGCFSTFRHRTKYAIGLMTYLELDLDETRLLTEFPPNHTLEAGHTPSCFPLRGFHTVSRCFSADFWSTGEARPLPAPHRYRLSAKLRFVLRGFQSPLLTASRLISFPGVTKMFQFSPFALAIARELTSMRHSAICGSMAACASPQLMAACHHLRRCMSQDIHLTAWELAYFTQNQAPMIAS